jgi:hypothetical protein
MHRVRDILFKKNINRYSNELQDIHLAIKLKPSFFFFGLISGFLIGFIFTGSAPDFSSQKYFPSSSLGTTK